MFGELFTFFIPSLLAELSQFSTAGTASGLRLSSSVCHRREEGRGDGRMEQVEAERLRQEGGEKITF